MRPLHDYFYQFPHEQLQLPGRCRVRIYKHKNGVHTVLLTEVNNITGESVASACERIVTDLTARWRLNPKTTRWIHHNPPQGDLLEEFARLKFTWSIDKIADQPQWQHLSSEQVEELTGERLISLNRRLGE